MAQKPFGRILAEARERKGMDINYVSQKLRIRADILRAIEQNDFSRMPARGYTRNMVNAYARLLGLNATSVTRQYLDEADRYIHSSHSCGSSSRSTSRQGRDGSRGTSRSSSSSYNRDFARTLNSNGGRDMYSDRDDHISRSSNRRVSYQDQPRSFGSGRNRRPGGYSGGYAASQPNPIMQNLPLIIGGIVALVLVIFIITQIVGCVAPKSNENVTSIPITGVSDTTNGSSNEGSVNTNSSATTSEPAPTSVDVTYTVASGNSTYVEIYQNDESIASEYGIITGPTSGQYTVTNKLEIRAVDSSQIQIKQDGADVAMTFDNDSGVYVYTVDFATVLSDWSKTHKSSTTSNTSNTANKNTNTSATTSTASLTTNSSNTNSR